MPEMFKVLPPGEALELFFSRLPVQAATERIATAAALNRVLAEEITAPSPLPSFARCTMDGYAVRAADTFGASETLPAFLSIAGEVSMGSEPDLAVGTGQAAVVYTGAMLPAGADAVVMIERTQKMDAGSVEVLRPVAPGENVIGTGEDIAMGQVMLKPGYALRPQDLGALMALGITGVTVAAKPRVAIISTGDEIVTPETVPLPGQVRDVNTYTISALVDRCGGIPLPGGIIADNRETLYEAARAALDRSDVLVLSAGSSVSTRDLTVEIAHSLGTPGVLVHGVAVRPGKPVILAVCDGKPVIGLPGNPVSALVVAGLFLEPLLCRMQGLAALPAKVRRTAFLTHNVSSAPGRVDYVQVTLQERDGTCWAEPVFGKSNLINTLVRAEGMVCIPLDSSGLYKGEQVEVELF